jgi:hypothetical protein
MYRNKMGEACSTYDGEESCIQGFGGKLKGKRPLGRFRCRSKNNIKLDLQEVRWGTWICLICLRIGTDGGHLLVNAVMNFRVP